MSSIKTKSNVTQSKVGFWSLGSALATFMTVVAGGALGSPQQAMAAGGCMGGCMDAPARQAMSDSFQRVKERASESFEKGTRGPKIIGPWVVKSTGIAFAAKIVANAVGAAGPAALKASVLLAGAPITLLSGCVVGSVIGCGAFQSASCCKPQRPSPLARTVVMAESASSRSQAPSSQASSQVSSQAPAIATAVVAHHPEAMTPPATQELAR